MTLSCWVESSNAERGEEEATGPLLLHWGGDVGRVSPCADMTRPAPLLLLADQGEPGRALRPTPPAASSRQSHATPAGSRLRAAAGCGLVALSGSVSQSGSRGLSPYWRRVACHRASASGPELEPEDRN